MKIKALIVVVAAALIGINSANAASTIQSKKLVKTEVIAASTDVDNRKFPGKVRAVKRVNMAFQVHGVLVELNVKEGEKVSKGQILARLDDRDFRNNLTATKAKLKEVRLNYKRSEKLYKQQVIAKAKYDEIKAALDALEANARIIEKQLQETKLIAPFSGVIAKRYVQNYENIMAKSPIVSLQDNSGIEVVIQIPESLMIKGVDSEFNNAQVIFDAAQEKTYAAKLSEVSTDADPYSQTYSVVLSMESPADLNVLPGMTATVLTAPKQTFAAVGPITVPLAAVFPDVSGNNFVWRVTAQKSLEKVSVKIGEIVGDRIEILAGIDKGDKLVVAGANLLSDGDKIRELSK